MEQEITLDQHCADYLEAKTQIRTLKQELKEIKDVTDDIEELEDLTIRVKELREKVNSDPDVKTIMDKLDTVKNRLDLKGEIIAELLKAQQLTIFVMDSGEFSLASKLKFKKVVKKK
jgi:cell fate (sporulation/competence/biofilm development) regulator YlbF (YheA/YmcA/DUF963 family)